MASQQQTRMIYGLAKRAGLDAEVGLRDLMHQVAGVSSTRNLTIDTANRVIDRLQVIIGDDPARAETRGGRPARAPAEGALALEGPFVGKLRALWLTAWNLGLTESRTDMSLAEFVGRQTGIDSPSWVRNPTDASKAIEGLKAWIARESGLVWPKNPRDVRLLKWTLVRRQWEILLERGMPIRLMKWSDLADYAAGVVQREQGLFTRPVISMTLDELTEQQLDKIAGGLGARIRKAKGGGA